MDLANITNILQSMTGNTGQRVAQIENQAAQMSANTAQIENLLNANITDAPAVADAAADIARQEATVQHRVQSQIQKYQAMYGLDPDDMNNAVAQGMAEFNAAEDARKEARTRYDRVASQDFLSNPVGYILGQLQLPSLVAENNAQVARRDAAEQNMLARKNLLREFKSTVTANTADEALQINLQRADQARKIAEMELREAEAGMLSKIGGMKLQEWQHRNSIFAVQDAAFAKQLQVAQWQMQMEIRAEEREERRARAAEIAKAKDMEAEDEARLNLQLQRLSQHLGMDMENPMTIRRLRLLPQAVAEPWLVGAMTADVEGRLSADLNESLDFINRFGNRQFMAETNPGVAQAIQNYETGITTMEGEIARQALNDSALARLNPAQRRQLAAERYQQQVIDAASQPGSGNSLTSERWTQVFNPYRARYDILQQAANARPESRLANNVVSKNVGLILGDEVRNLTTEEERQVHKAIVMAVANGTLPPREAAEQVSEYYAAAAMKNREFYQYDLYGFVPQTRYMGQLAPVTWWGAPQNVDFMNTSSVERALLLQAAAYRQTQRSVMELDNDTMRPEGTPMGFREFLTLPMQNR